VEGVAADVGAGEGGPGAVQAEVESSALLVESTRTQLLPRHASENAHLAWQEEMRPPMSK
jgi:hypothetical protein